MARQSVIFDMDGVLVASAAPHKASWQMVARREGIDFTEELFQRTFGRPSRDIIRIVWGEHVSDEEIARIDAAKEACYRDLITGMVPLTIGTRETLHALAGSGFALAVATSGPPENVELVLRETRLADQFAAVVTGFDVERGKPAPDCFLLAAERCGVAPADCVVIEDAPVGIQAAKAGGMKVIGLAGTHAAERLQAEQPDRVVEKMYDLTPEVIRSVLRE